MRAANSRTGLLLGAALACSGCGDDTNAEATTTLPTGGGDEAGETAADGSESMGESGATMGDGDAGDGDGSAGDGDGSAGDGDGSAGDGDGDGSVGDGDGSSGDGDGSSGDGTSGDGDGTSGDGTSGDGDGTTAGDGDGTSGDGTAGDGDGSSGDGDGTAGDGDGDGDPMCLQCAPNTDLIFVLSDAAELWSFDPATLMFNFVADLPCPGLFTGTFSMSVDRRGIAHVLYQDGSLFTVDVNNPTQCVDPGWTNPSPTFTSLFGMGFASNGGGDRCENLYIHSFAGGGFSEGPNIGNLGRIQPGTLALSVQGPTNFNGAELTGNASGQLFAFAGVPAKLIEFDKNTGTEIGSPIVLTGLDLTNAFAFATYDGDFYFFTEEVGTIPTTSKVNFFDPTVPGVYTQVASAPMRIVGAGVSTCAPSPQ